MAPPKRKGGGRVTPKGTKPSDAAPAHSAFATEERARHAPSASARYTPPTRQLKGPSPRWVPVLMFGLLVGGTLVIILNYLALLPGATSNWYLPVGLGLILGGIMTATQYR